MGVSLLKFNPHPLLRSAHVQTVLSSRLVRQFDATGNDLLDQARTVTIECGDGVRLQAVVNETSASQPLVIIIHGWLGRADSPYVRRAAVALNRAGFNVARLLLRDHGDTGSLNEEMFNSARIVEVVAATNWLVDQYGTAGGGIMGFSLGGNFALRVARDASRHPRLQACLAVCPVIDPEKAVRAIDDGWVGYRWYFLRKWRQALVEKQGAFPDAYDLDAALKLPSVAALTDYLVARHLPFVHSREYYQHYTLTGNGLAGLEIPTRILAAADDPVVPIGDVETLDGSRHLDVVVSRFGGHCGFIEDFRLRSALDWYTPEFFTSKLLQIT